MSIAIGVIARRAVQSARTAEPTATALPAQAAAARSRSTRRRQVRITSELIDAYEDEARRLRTQAIKHAVETIAAAFVRLWRLAVR